MVDGFKKILRPEIVLIALILFGVFFRFYNLDIPLQGDEIIYGVASMKFHQQSFEAGKDYILEHPPLGKWLVGLPAKFTAADYEPLKLLGKDMFVWAYMAYDALAKNFQAMRTVEAIMGTLSLLLVFLISRQLFGLRAALWSTVTAALSFELVGFSRTIYMESPMILFTLLTLFIYINYLKSLGKKRILYLALFFISLTATLLTRHIQPLFLLPIFTISQFALNRNLKENLYFLLLVGISYSIAFKVIFPQDILGYGQSRFGYSSVFGFFAFKMFSVIGHLIFRNSFLFLAALIASAYLFFKSIGKVTIRQASDNPASVLVIFFVASFMMFSFLSFPLPRHYIFMFIPLYIVSGYAITQVTKNKILLSGIILLTLINATMFVQYFPRFLIYTNFGLGGFESVSNAYDQIKLLRENLDDLSNASTVMTNDPNVLIFFSGQKIPLTPSLEKLCNNATIDSLDLDNITVLYMPHSKNFNLMSDQFVCPLLRTKLAQSSAVRILER